MTRYEGKLVAPKGRFAVIVSRFNEFITSKLLGGAMDALVRHGVAEANIDVVWSPGSFEIPLLAQKLAASEKYAAVICLGAVIRGGTDHYQYVASEVSKGVAHASLATGVPCIFGVLTCDTIEQAIERAGAKAGNKGSDAAAGAIEMANLLAQLPSAPECTIREASPPGPAHRLAGPVLPRRPGRQGHGLGRLDSSARARSPSTCWTSPSRCSRGPGPAANSPTSGSPCLAATGTSAAWPWSTATSSAWPSGRSPPNTPPTRSSSTRPCTWPRSSPRPRARASSTASWTPWPAKAPRRPRRTRPRHPRPAGPGGGLSGSAADGKGGHVSCLVYTLPRLTESFFPAGGFMLFF